MTVITFSQAAAPVQVYSFVLLLKEALRGRCGKVRLLCRISEGLIGLAVLNRDIRICLEKRRRGGEEERRREEKERFNGLSIDDEEYIKIS